MVPILFLPVKVCVIHLYNHFYQVYLYVGTYIFINSSYVINIIVFVVRRNLWSITGVVP